MTGRPKALLELTSDEKEQLERWVRRRNSAQGLALRSQIVLSCATGLTNKEVAAQLGISMPTVGKWRSRFIDSRLDGLVDEPRSGRKPTITAEQVEDVVVATLESTPEHATHWSRKKMAERSGLSKSTIGRIWKGFGLKPHLADGFKLSNDPLVRGQGLRRRRALPQPSRGRRCAVRGREVAGPGAGKIAAGVPDDARHARETHPRLRPQRHHQPVRRVQHRRRHRHLQPAPTAPLHRVQEVPDQDRHPGPRRPGRAPDLRQLQHPQEPRHQDLAGRPTPGSRCISPPHIPAGSTRSNGSSRSSPKTSCNAAITTPSNNWKQTSAAWIKDWNTHPKPFIWTKSADEILESLGRLLKRISGAGH